MKKLITAILLLLTLTIPQMATAVSMEDLDRDPDTYIQFRDNNHRAAENIDAIEVKYKGCGSNYDTFVMWESQGVVRVNIFGRAKRNSDVEVCIFLNGKKDGTLRLRVGRVNGYMIK